MFNMNIALVESPFQLLQALEILNSNGKCIFLIRLNNIEKNNKQLKEIISKFKVPNVLYIHSHNKFNLIFYFVPLLLAMRLSQRIYIGDENSFIFRVIRRFLSFEKIYLLDDGVATLIASRNYGYKRYTIFENVKGIKNTLNYCQNILEKEEKERRVNVIIGGKLVEEGICAQDCYHDILQEIIGDFDSSPIIYIPHRGESVKNIVCLSQKFDFEILQNNLPAELIGLEFKIDPICVVSVLSTALYSMSLIYKNTDFKVYPLKNSDVLSRQDAIKNLYEQMKLNTNFFEHKE